MTQLTRRRPRKWLGRCRRAERPHRESAALRRFRACRWRGVGVRPLKVAEHEPAFFDRLAVVVRRPPLEPADKHFGGARSTGQPRRTARRTGPGWRRFRTPRASARSRSREALRSHPRARHSRRPRRTTHSRVARQCRLPGTPVSLASSTPWTCQSLTFPSQGPSAQRQASRAGRVIRALT